MGGSKSNTLELKLLDHVLGGPDYVRPATVYCAIYTVAPGEGGGGTEVTGGAYARVAITNNATNFPAAASGRKSNGTAITFPTATANWGEVVAAALHDHATADQPLYYGKLLGPQVPFTALAATDIVTAPGHTFVNDNEVKVEPLSGFALPTGLVDGTKYYIIGVSGNTFQLSATVAGAAINITADGAGLIALNKSKTITTDDTFSFAIDKFAVLED